MRRGNIGVNSEPINARRTADLLNTSQAPLVRRGIDVRAPYPD